MKKLGFILLMLLGAITARAQTTGVPGNPVPCCGTQILGTDGTNSRGIKTDSSGVVQTASTPPSGASATQVQGTAANGTATVGNPVWICGLNGGNCVAVLVDASGRVLLGASGQVIGAVTQSGGPWTINETQWAGGSLGAPSNYGTSPGAVTVPGVNAFVTNTPAVTQSGGPWTTNQTQLNSVALGSPSNFGTGPGAVAVPGANVSMFLGTATPDVNSGTVSNQTQRNVLATNVAVPTSTGAPSSSNAAGGLQDTGGVARAFGMRPIPSSNASDAISPSATGSAASSLVLKASAGNLYSVQLTTGATSGLLMVFDATSAPGDGAVTPKYCVQIAANSTVTLNWSGPPASFATGITAVFSSGTNCFSKTASATAFISGQVQ